MLADVDNRMRVAQEEIFGPVACLLPFKDEAEGLRPANDVEYGGVVHLDPDVSKVLRLARNIEAGMVFVNTQNVRDLRQPFGGVKASGTGREGRVQLRGLRGDEERLHLHGRPSDSKVGI